MATCNNWGVTRVKEKKEQLWPVMAFSTSIFAVRFIVVRSTLTLTDEATTGKGETRRDWSRRQA